MKDETFLRKSAMVDQGMAFAEWACWKFLAVTTAVMSYGLFDSFLSGKLDGPILVAARTAGILMFYLIVDYGLTDGVRYVVRELSEKDIPRPRRIFLNFLILITIVRIVATATTSWWAAPEVAEVITTDGKTDEYLAGAEKVTEAQAMRENSANKTAADLQASEPKRLAEAENKGRVLIANAIATGNRWQQESMKSEGSGWLASPANPDQSDKNYVARIKAAKNQAAALVDAERKKTADASKGFAEVAGDTTAKSQAGVLLRLAEDERKAREARLSRRTAFLWVFDVIAVLLGCLLSYLRTQRHIAGGMEEEKSMAFVLSRAGVSYRKRLIEFVESILGVDMDGDGHVGAAPQQPEPQPAQRVPVMTQVAHAQQPVSHGAQLATATAQLDTAIAQDGGATAAPQQPPAQLATTSSSATAQRNATATGATQPPATEAQRIGYNAIAQRSGGTATGRNATATQAQRAATEYVNKTVPHIDRQTGATKMLRYDQVLANLRANRSKLGKAENTGAHPDTVKEIKTVISYWETKVNEFNR